MARPFTLNRFAIMSMSANRSLISGVQTEVESLEKQKRKDGAQIDMIIDRADRVINVC